MPWREVKPMDEKLLFIADFVRGGHLFTSLCAQYGISRKTGYKWVQRYRDAGLEGLGERSRRPSRSPLETPYSMRQAIVQLRKKGTDPPGPKKIRALLRKQYSENSIPSKTTIYNILRKEALVRPVSQRRRVARSPQPFAPVREPNDLWTADYKGQFRVRSGNWCYPLTVMDHKCRYLLCCQALEGTCFTDAQEAFTRMFKEYGLPWRIRTDNGVPFATTAVGGLSRLSVWWIRLGIVPERIRPGKPQENGRHERMHRTLKKATAVPPAHSMVGQQRRFKRFLKEYNDERPHEALGQRTPVSVYHSSERSFPARLPELEYPGYYDVRKVTHSGTVYWKGGQVYISNLLSGEWVGLNEIDENAWDVYYAQVPLGRFKQKDMKGRSTPYATLKV